MNPEKAVQLANLRDAPSTVLEKIAPDLRRRVNRAIVERDPPTYKGIHRRFQLDALGVGYHAFYRYARRLRAEAALFELAGLAAPPEADVPALLPRILAQRLLETLAFDDVGPRQLQRLTDAYRASVTALALIRRHCLLPKRAAPNDSLDELAQLVNEYRELLEQDAQSNDRADVNEGETNE